MATELTVRGVPVKKRSPWGVWGLSLITVGIYAIVHWNRINIELRDVSAAMGQPFGNNPNIAVLSVFPGSIVYVPLFLTIADTTQRVRGLQQMTSRAGEAGEGVNASWSLLLSLLGLHSVYLQTALNECWDSEDAVGRGFQSLTPSPAGSF